MAFGVPPCTHGRFDQGYPAAPGFAAREGRATREALTAEMQDGQARMQALMNKLMRVGNSASDARHACEFGEYSLLPPTALHEDPPQGQGIQGRPPAVLYQDGV